MLQFQNTTPFAGTVALTPDVDGTDSLWTIVKGTFSLSAEVTVAEKQVPIALADAFQGEPARTSLKSAADVALTKPGTDVLLLGTACAPGGRAVGQMDVSLAVGPVQKTVRVFGDRVWKSGLLGARLSPPEPFERMPLVWERAFGGSDVVEGDPPLVQAEDRNPVGAGFRVEGGKKALDGLRLPNLEDPRRLISSWKDRPAPAAFGPLAAHWEPRRTYAGTYDEAWQKRRAPYLPKDFDPRFFQVAPPGQVAPGHLKGGERVEVVGALPSGPLTFCLPEVVVEVAYRLDGTDQLRQANLDTVVIEPDEARLVLVWRSVLACDKKALRVSRIRAALGSHRGRP